MIKVLCVSQLSDKAPSGVITYIRNLRRYFEEDNTIQITFASIDDTPFFWARVAGLARRIINLFSFVNKGFTEYSFDVKNRILVHFAVRRFRKESFDLINAQDILSGHVAKKIFRGRLPLIVTCHFNENPVEEDMLRYQLKESSRPYLVRRYSRKFSQVDEFIFVAGYTLRKARYLLPDQARTRIIYNGLDFSRYPGKINNGPVFSILNTGHVEARKNQKLFIPIAKELMRRSFGNFRITIVGTGPDLDDLKNTVEREGLASHFFFAGWSDNIPAYLAISDLYIHTSLNDICPYSVTEAIAAGVPALALKVGGLPEMMPEEQLFAVDDHTGIVSYLLEHVDQLSDIADVQFEKIRYNFSYTTQVGEMAAAYSGIAGKPVSDHSRSITRLSIIEQ